MGRGRPKKIENTLPLLEQRKIALDKFYKHGELLTLDETALAIWNPETEKKPMTRMGMQKFEARILAKLKKKLAEYGINDFSDVFESRRCAPMERVATDSVQC